MKMIRTFDSNLGNYHLEKVATNPRSVRTFVEILFYAALACRVFGNVLGILSVEGLSGAIIVMSGIMTILIMVNTSARVPITFYFMLTINAISNITDLAIYGMLTREMIFWISTFIMSYFILDSDRAVLRAGLIMSSMIIISVSMSGVFLGQEGEIYRLGLAENQAGSMFSNSNSLAKISCIAMLLILFNMSAYDRFAYILSGILCIGLLVVILLTLSRQGLVYLSLITLSYLIHKFITKRLIISMAACLVLISLFVIFSTPELVNIVDGYKMRFGQPSERFDYIEEALPDILTTFFVGHGTHDSYLANGIKPHNSFMWLSLAYGGACAAVYSLWIIWLCIITYRILTTGTIGEKLKIESLTITTLFILSQFTAPFDAYNYGFILSVAVLHKNYALISDGSINT